MSQINFVESIDFDPETDFTKDNCGENIPGSSAIPKSVVTELLAKDVPETETDGRQRRLREAAIRRLAKDVPKKGISEVFEGVLGYFDDKCRRGVVIGTRDGKFFLLGFARPNYAATVIMRFVRTDS